MAHLSKQMAKVAYAIKLERKYHAGNQAQKDVIDGIIQTITMTAFGSHSRKQVAEFKRITNYRSEHYASVSEILEKVGQ